MKKIILFFFAIMMLTIASSLFAQPITLKMKRPGLNQLKAADLWSATITNNGEAFTAYLYGSMTNNENGELIATGQTVTFEIKRGTTNFKVSDLPSVPDINYLSIDPKYKESFMNTGGAPPGDYKICVELRYTNNSVAGEDCFDQKIIGGDAPQLISPRNEEELIMENPVFTWMHMKGPGSTQTYSLRIVELKGNESPENAMLKNKAFFEKEGISQQLLQYPTSASKFEEGKSYVWGIKTGEKWSNFSIFRPRGGNKISCRDLKVSITQKKDAINIRDDKKDSRIIINYKEKGCCYDLSITNTLKSISSGPSSFKIISNNTGIISASGHSSDYNMSPANISIDTRSIVWSYNKGNIPTTTVSLGSICFDADEEEIFYVSYEWLDAKGNILCKDSIEVSACGNDCKNNVIRNGGFNQSTIQGVMPSPGTSMNWASGYGAPNIYYDPNDPNEGFFEAGHVKFTGNLSGGQSIVQALDPNNKFLSGKYYKLSVAVKFNSSQNSIDYGKIRAIAFNGSIANAPGTHPVVSTNVAVIGRSGKIKDCGVWTIVEFPVWKANKDFSNIAINVFTNDNQNATVLIDNVSLCESSKEDCVEMQVDNNGNPVIPSSVGDPPPGFNCQPEADNDDYFNGSLQDLYPAYNGTTDMYSQMGSDDPCFSVGGTVPEDVLNFNCNDSMQAAGTGMTCEQINTLINDPLVINDNKVPVFPPVPPLTNFNCDTLKKPNYDNMAFKGRDIIYIHGLQLSHLIDRAGQYPPTVDNWPANKQEIYSGYYKTAAYANMHPHIQHFLKNTGNKNRILLVAYNCAEDMETAIHGIMSQIRDAMDNGTGVEADRNDPRGTRCFGRDYVFISHSTGALVSDVVLSIANKTKTAGAYQTKYGNVGYLSDRCKGRISIQGAFSGSNLAKLACQLGLVTPTFAGMVLTALSHAPLSNQSINTLLNANPQIILRSILVDLTPEITRARWGSLINDITVPVITMAGGHPSAILNFLKYWMHPGFDDGVLDMDCAGGVNNPLVLGPSRFTAVGHKVFDMGIPFGRAKKYYLDQTIGSYGSFASAMTPYLSPSGMVQPVQNIAVPQNYFNNHFPFVQAAKEHWFNTTEPGSGNTPCDYSLSAGAVNNEEELVVNNSSLFANGIIDPSIIPEMGETVRKLSIWLPWFKWKKWRGIRIPVVYWREFIIWKRTYHKLKDNCQYDVDYAYKYLFRQ